MAAGRRPVNWSEGARDDLAEAIAFIAQDAQAAAGLLDRILAAAEALDELGERGRIVPEVRDPNTRELLVDPVRGKEQLTAFSETEWRSFFEE